jgi:flagellin
MVSILTNVAAMSASRQLGITSHGMQTTIERLTTGKRINRSSDDAAGLVNADQFDAQARIAGQDVQAANNSFFAAQANDGYLGEATTQVQRLVELYEGGNGSSAEATSVLANANAAMTKAGQASLTITSLGTATAALTTIDTARGTFAATMATQLSAANLAGISKENATSQLGNIMDADIGSEVVNLTKWQILAQSGTSALSNANQSSQYVLALLR